MRALRTSLTSPIFLKVTSLILGFLLWNTINHLFTYSTWVTVPVCFYNAQKKQIDAPEYLTVELTGKRSLLRHINKESLAAHIDAKNLSVGTHKLTVTSEHLLLPPSISTTTVIPHYIIVTITRGES